jgi:hypothetical protein
MDWDRYKALCDSPDVCSRWLLEQTLELVVDPAVAARLRAALEAAPVPKPDDHQGADDTDMFRMSLSLAEVRGIRRRVDEAIIAGITTSGTRERGLGGFAETWQEYQRYLERPAGDGPT